MRLDEVSRSQSLPSLVSYELVSHHVDSLLTSNRPVAPRYTATALFGL